MFNVTNTHCILSTEIVPGSGTTPYLCASAENNAVSSYIGYREDLKEAGNCIFIGGKTFVVSYQENDFFSNDSHNLALYLDDEVNATKPHLLFMAACIARSLGHKYTWGNSISKQKIKSDFVSLPMTASGEIDFAFMDSFIRELEEERIRELAAYLKVSGLADSKLSASERKALDRFGKEGFAEFRLEDIFTIDKTSGFNSDRLVDGDEYDYITRTSFNQGILKSTGHVDGGEINAAGTWSLGLLQMDFFYRKKPWYAGQFVRKITPKILMSDMACHFFSGILNKQKKHLLSVLVRNVDETFRSSKVMLPVTPLGSPDYGYMETFMRAVQKLVVKDVADLAAKRISATKKCVKGGCRLMENLAVAPEEEEALRLAADDNGE